MSGQLEVAERRAVRWKARNATIEALTALEGEASRSAVVARARELGGFTPREFGAVVPAGAANKYANPVEHALAWALTNLKRDGLVENPRRGVWRLTNVAAAPAELAADPVATESRLAELRAMPYADYLRTAEWARTRAGALARAQHRCVLDARHTTQLEVHHNTYDRLGAELASDLAVLCRTCHRLHHKTNGRPRWTNGWSTAKLTAALESGGTRREGSIAPPGYVEEHHGDHGNGSHDPPSPPRGFSWLRRVFVR